MKNKFRTTTRVITSSVIFLRMLFGFAAGFVGSAALGIILMLTWSTIGDTLAGTIGTSETELASGASMSGNPLFLIIITFSIFSATLIFSMVYAFLATIIDEKYAIRSTALVQIFFGNLVILLLFLPVHLLFSRVFGVDSIAVAGILHAATIAFFTILALEILNARNQIFVSAYGLLTGLVLFFFFGSILLKDAPTAFVFIVLPLIGVCLGAGSGIAEVFYNWFYRTYGIDFLNTEMRFGSEYSEKADE